MIPRFGPLLALALLASVATGCATFPAARPLEPGYHEVGVSIGGPVLRFGDGAIPVPNINVQGRHGVAAPLDRPLDVTYGVNLVGLPFGILEGHVGASWLLVHQKGPMPALAIADKQFFATNALGLRNKPDAVHQGWAANQLELYLSWEISSQLIYTGLTQYFDFGNPQLTLTPSVGAEFDTTPKKPGGLQLHLDLRWFAMTQVDQYDAIKWFPRPLGAFGFGFGVSYVIAPRRPATGEVGG